MVSPLISVTLKLTAGSLAIGVWVRFSIAPPRLCVCIKGDTSILNGGHYTLRARSYIFPSRMDGSHQDNLS